MRKVLFLIFVILTFAFVGCNEITNSKSPEGLIKASLFTMPYNKVLSPAGSQLFFGDSALENHALDVALPPNKKNGSSRRSLQYCVYQYR